MAQAPEERYISPVARVRSQLSARSNNEEEEEEDPIPERQPTTISTGIRSEVSLLEVPVEAWSYNDCYGLADFCDREGTNSTRLSQ